MKKLMLIVVLLFMSFNAFALSEVVNGVCWYYETFTVPGSGGEAAARIISGTYSGDITIPQTLRGCPVTQIDEMAFQNCRELLSVRIPEGVMKIGKMAFWGCDGLVKAAIPDSVLQIGEEAFYDCRELKAVTIPKGVARIEKSTFCNCSGLESVMLHEKVESIGSGAFESCRSIKTLKIPEGVKCIEQSAFRGCRGLTTITVPKSVMSIGTWAFADCSGLTSIELPFVGAHRGSGEPFGCIFRQSSSFNYEYTCSGKMAAVSTYDYSGTLKGYTYFPPELKTVVITDETRIGRYAFAGWCELVEVSIPESVTSIGEFAFWGCKGLGEGVVIVDDCLLTVNGTCSNSVVIPQGVRLIADSAFYGCKELRSVTIPSTLTTIANSAFWGCGSLTSVTMPSGVTSIGKNAFSRCGLDRMTIPEGVTSIDDYAFEGCRTLKSVTIPESVERIGYGAFFGCSSLASVAMPKSLPRIGAEAFSGCPVKITIPPPSKPEVCVKDVGGNEYSGYVEISWADVEGAESYNLYRSNDDSYHNTPPCATGITSPYRDYRTAPGLTPGVKYYYWLEAVNYSGKSRSDLVFGVLSASLSISQSTDSYTSVGGSADVSVAANTSWSATRNVSWISFFDGGSSGSGNGTLRYKVAENATMSTRTGVITVTAASGTSYPITRKITVVQTGVPPEVTASDGLYTDCVRIACPNGTASTLCNIYRSTTTRCPTAATWNRVTLPYDDTTAIPGVKYYYWVEASESPSSPISSYEKGYRAVSLSLDNAMDSFSAAGGNGSVLVSANTSWSAVSYSGWIALGAGSGAGDGVLTYVIEKNMSETPRTAAIAVTAGLGTDYPVTQTIKVTQGGKTDFTIVGGVLMKYHGTDSVVNIPANVTGIDPSAFEGCDGLTAFTVEKGNTAFCVEGGLLYSKDKTSLIRCPQGRKTPIELLNVKRIGAFAFCGCRYLSSITIPSSVTVIEDSAFVDCTGLKSVFILTSSCVVNIGMCAFDGCGSLATIYLPKNTTGAYRSVLADSATGMDVDKVSFVEALGDGGPYTETTQDGITWEFTVKNGCAAIAPSAWGKPLYEPAISTKTTGAIMIPKLLGNCPVTSLGRLAFCNCSNLTSVTIPFSVKELGANAFKNCKNITSMTIPLGVTSIGGSVFEGCTRLESVSLPESVTNFGDYVFAYCVNLTSVELPSGLQGIPLGTFYLCEGLKSVRIPPNVMRIGDTAFYGCRSLTSMAIPPSVVSVEWYAFSSCTRLQSLVIPWCCERIDEGSFTDCDALKVVYVDKGYSYRIKLLYDWPSSVEFVEIAPPVVMGDDSAIVSGDPIIGYVIKPSEGRTAVEVTIPQGVDAAKVTVEVSPKVASVKPNGAKVKIVSGGADITEFLNMPVADGDGVVDLTKAAVKEEIVKETMDVEKGAKIVLDAANPSLTTPNTRVGLFYQLREGVTIEGMANGDSTIGDGKPWSPEIKIKGGNSAFYSIEVGKGE